MLIPLTTSSPSILTGMLLLSKSKVLVGKSPFSDATLV
ncbi:hypothetical protein C5167_021680, partial [Papaver somniferum]